jgi:hypothetical protein
VQLPGDAAGDRPAIRDARNEDGLAIEKCHPARLAFPMYASLPTRRR